MHTICVCERRRHDVTVRCKLWTDSIELRKEIWANSHHSKTRKVTVFQHSSNNLSNSFQLLSFLPSFLPTLSAPPNNSPFSFHPEIIFTILWFPRLPSPSNTFTPSFYLTPPSISKSTPYYLAFCLPPLFFCQCFVPSLFCIPHPLLLSFHLPTFWLLHLLSHHIWFCF